MQNSSNLSQSTILQTLPKSTTNSILNATATGDQQLVKTILKKYISNGSINYLEVLRIPAQEKITELAKIDRPGLNRIISAQIIYMLEYFNLRYGFSPNQVMILADEIMDDSESDYLSVQDLYLFLFQLATGKMGKIYDRMDIPTFMEMFEQYRQERHEAYLNYKYEQEQQYKTYGDNTRTTIDTEKELHRTAFSEHLKNQFKP